MKSIKYILSIVFVLVGIVGVKVFAFNNDIAVMPVLVSIEITNPANKLTYNLKDELDISGLEVTGTYTYYTNVLGVKNDILITTKEVIPITKLNITGFDSSTAKTGQVLTITVDGKTATYQVKIASDISVTSPLIGLTIVHPANKLSYKIGEAFDITGLVVAGNYKNGTSKIEDITIENITGFNSSTDKNGQVLTITYGGKTITFPVNIESASVNTGGGGSSSSGGYIRRLVSVSPPVGQVLGASTENNGVCSELYLNKYIKSGSKNNDVTQVVKLQLFLNEHLGTNLLTDGNYGQDTVVAVNAFQVKNRQQVLTPWIPYGLEANSMGTGYVYKTTQRWINLIKCPELNIPIPVPLF